MILNLNIKVRAIRILRRLSQENTAYQAHFHIKTYQRKEAGTSPITEQDLQQLTIPFHCTMDDIRNFDLEANAFKSVEKGHFSALEAENKFLKSEVNYLRQLIDKLLTSFSNSTSHELQQNQ